MITILSWIGTISSVFGSFAVAMGFFKFGYINFLVGSACWLWVGFSRREKPLIVLNLVFLLANILGVYNFIFRG